MKKRNFMFKKAEALDFINLNRFEKELVRKWRNNPGINKWMYSRHLISKMEHSLFLRKLRKDKKNIYWLIKAKDGRYAGIIFLNRIDTENVNAYLGIYSNPDEIIPGTGCFLIEYLKFLGFKKMNLHTIKLEVIANNKRAIKFYKKNGFKYEGKLKQYFKNCNKWHDVLIMGIIKP